MKKDILFIPGPVTVSERVLSAMSAPLIDHRGPKFAALSERICEGLRRIFGTRDAQMLLLGSSGTGGLEAAIVNVFSPGERVLAAPVGVFGRRMAAIARTYGLEVEVLATEDGACLDPQALRQALHAHRYAGVLLTHNETSTGVQNDMGALAAVAREHDALCVVDSVSGMGATPFMMDAWGYDVVVSASQKVLAAPPGAAMVAISARAWDFVERSRMPRFYFDLRQARDFAREGQTPWTPPVSTLFALDAAIAQYEEEGPQNVWRRHDLYARAIRAAFIALDLPLFSRPNAHSVTVVAAKVPPAVDAAELLRALREDRGVVLSGGQLELKGKIVRMGTMGDISQTDVLGAIGALEIALLDYQLPSRVGAGLQAALRVFLDREESSRRDDDRRTVAPPVAETAEASR